MLFRSENLEDLGLTWVSVICFLYSAYSPNTLQPIIEYTFLSKWTGCVVG